MKRSDECPFEPMDQKLICVPEQAPDRSKGGIFLPDVAKDKRTGKAKVIAIGPGKLLDDGTRLPLPNIAIGDTVVYGRFAGHEVSHEGKEYLVLHTDDVMAVVR